MYDKSVKTRMAGMSPQQLKEFATLHKDDPFIVSMALNIDNDRKALQREQAMRAAGQPQPAVVDQTLAAIGEPEMPQQDMPPQAMPPQAAPQMQAGLPQLPAQNIATMADGGIAGYAAGDEVKASKEGVEDRSNFRAYARQKAAALGLDPDFVDGIFKIESNYDPKAKSKTGPQGIGQLTEYIAKQFGISPKDRSDPYKNMDASLGFLDYLNKKYKGDKAKVAVAYNQGEPVLDAHLKQNNGQLVADKLHENVKTANKQEPFNYLKKLTTAGAIEPMATREAPRTPEMLARQKEAQRKREIAEAVPLPAAQAAEAPLGKPTGAQQIAAIEQRLPVEEIIRREQAQAAERKKVEAGKAPKVLRDVAGMPEAAASLVSGAFAPATALLPYGLSRITGKPLTYEESMDAATFAPRSEVGKESLGEAYRALEEFKVPAYIPGIGAPRRPSAKGPSARAAALATEAELAAAREKIAAPRLTGPAPEVTPTSKFTADVAAAARARVPKTPLMQEIEQARALETGRKEFSVAPETAALGEEALARRRTVEQAQADLRAKAADERVPGQPAERLTPEQGLEADKARTAELEQKLLGDQARASDLGFEDLRTRQALEARRAVDTRYDVGRQLSGGAAGAAARGPGEVSAPPFVRGSEEPGFDFSKPETEEMPAGAPIEERGTTAIPEKKTSGFTDDDWIMMGLNMLQAPPGQAGGMLSQLGQNLGRSGIATMGAKREREKAALAQAQQEALSNYYRGMTEQLGKEPEQIRVMRALQKEPGLFDTYQEMQTGKQVAAFARTYDTEIKNPLTGESFKQMYPTLQSYLAANGVGVSNVASNPQIEGLLNKYLPR
jgi:soluble lytic murein transglycosylase-like protein